MIRKEPGHANDYDFRLDIAKSVFQVHGVNVDGNVVVVVSSSGIMF
jgi:hypothetical protein